MRGRARGVESGRSVNARAGARRRGWAVGRCAGGEAPESGPLADGRPDSPELRPPRNAPVHPDTDSVSDQVVLRHESDLREAAVLAIVAVVAHEKIMSRRHDAIEVGGEPALRQHDDV